jgi:hypothetical protein
MPDTADARSPFWRIAAAGMSFLRDSAAVASATTIARFVHTLTGSSIAGTAELTCSN